MNETLRKYIVTYPSDIKTNQSHPFPCVQMIYRISESGMLQRIPSYSSQNRNIMGLSDSTGLKNCDPDRLCRDVVTEYMRRGYAGIVLNIELENTDLDKLEKICSYLSQKKIIYFLPVELAQISADAKIIVPSSISGGSISQMLKMLTDKYSPSRICMELVRTCSDFEMPSYKPDGTAISADALNELMVTHDAQSFFSSELGCKYFTYRQDGNAHFVLYDDSEMASYKIRLAQTAGFYGVFMVYSQWSDSLNIILNQN